MAQLSVNRADMQPLVPHVASAVRAGLECAGAAAVRCVEEWSKVGLTMDALHREQLLSVLWGGTSTRYLRLTRMGDQFHVATGCRIESRLQSTHPAASWRKPFTLYMYIARDT